MPFLPFLNWREADGEPGSYAMLIYPEIEMIHSPVVNRNGYQSLTRWMGFH